MGNNKCFINVILDHLVNYYYLPEMSISPIFAFAPVPLTSERSPLAHAAVLARRRQAESHTVSGPVRHRIRPAKKTSETAV